MKPITAPSIARADRLADLFAPATVVLFAGAGGTCIGIEQAYVDGGYRDKYVDLAINHWDTAVGVHALNHPMTQHIQASRSAHRISARVARVIVCGKTEMSYVVDDDNGNYSHGKTLKEARESLKFKISNRDTSEFRAWKPADIKPAR